MDENKSSIEILKQFARQTNREIDYSEMPYPSVVMHAVNYHRRTLYIPYNYSKTTFYVCFHDSKEFGDYKLFSGVFTIVDLPSTLVVKVTKKEVIHKLNPFLKKKIISTASNLDDKAIITGNDSEKAKRIFAKSNVQNLVIKSFQLNEGIIIGINTPEIEFVPQLKSKSLLGIFSIQEWFLDKERIEKLFDMAEHFRRIFNNADN